MKMDVWNIVLGPGKDIRSGTHYNSRSKQKTLAGRDSTSRSCTERCYARLARLRVWRELKSIGDQQQLGVSLSLFNVTPWRGQKE